jgi:hypothetical protein
MRVLLPLVASAALLAGCGSSPGPDVTAAAKAAGAQLLSPPVSGAGVHTTKLVAYASNPPTSGPHNPVWAADGDYAGTAPPPIGQIVHAQEHGRIVVQYRKGLPQSQVAQLEKLFEEKPYHLLLVENQTDMPCDVAAASWEHALLCKRLTPKALDAIRAFRDAYVDEGPEQIP